MRMSLKYHDAASRLFYFLLNSQLSSWFLSHNGHSINISKIMNSIGDYMWILLNSNVRLDATDENPGQLWIPLIGLLVGGKHIMGCSGGISWPTLPIPL